MLTTTLGLVFAIMGALALLLGLFRHSKPLYLGWQYNPPDAAKDAAYIGITCGFFLITGFVGQILGNTGVWHRDLTTAQAVAFAVGVACIGLVFAYLLFGIAYILAMGRDSGVILQRVRMTAGWAVLQDQLPGQR